MEFKDWLKEFNAALVKEYEKQPIDNLTFREWAKQTWDKERNGK
jgi:hypothetical protein